jgi:gliding motility-associated-like protein
LVATDSDNFYDTFQIDGLRNIFLNFKLSIYNRWGTLVWEGNNTTEDWDGTSTKGTHLLGNELPDGTYYYILELNDPDYPNPLNGFLHLKK